MNRIEDPQFAIVREIRSDKKANKKARFLKRSADVLLTLVGWVLQLETRLLFGVHRHQRGPKITLTAEIRGVRFGPVPQTISDADFHKIAEIDSALLANRTTEEALDWLAHEAGFRPTPEPKKRKRKK